MEQELSTLGKQLLKRNEKEKEELIKIMIDHMDCLNTKKSAISVGSDDDSREKGLLTTLLMTLGELVMVLNSNINESDSRPSERELQAKIIDSQKLCFVVSLVLGLEHCNLKAELKALLPKNIERCKSLTCGQIGDLWEKGQKASSSNPASKRDEGRGCVIC